PRAPPPRSPPLPYTTLFRSPPGRPHLRVPVAVRRRTRGARPRARALRRRPRRARLAVALELAPGLRPRRGRRRARRGQPAVHPPDRKSTRLNSSHVKISYAV